MHLLDFLRTPDLEDSECLALFCSLSESKKIFSEGEEEALCSILLERQWTRSTQFFLRYLLTQSSYLIGKPMLQKLVANVSWIDEALLLSFLLKYYAQACWFEEENVWTEIVELCASHGLVAVLETLRSSNPGNHPFPAYKVLTSASRTNQQQVLEWLLLKEEVCWSDEITKEACVSGAAHGHTDVTIALYFRFCGQWKESSRQSVEKNILFFASLQKNMNLLDWCVYQMGFPPTIESAKAFLHDNRDFYGAPANLKKYFGGCLLQTEILAMICTRRNFHPLFHEVWRAEGKHESTEELVGEIQELLLAVAAGDFYEESTNAHDFMLLDDLLIFYSASFKLTGKIMDAAFQHLVDSDKGHVFFSFLWSRWGKKEEDEEFASLLEKWTRQCCVLENYRLWRVFKPSAPPASTG